MLNRKGEAMGLEVQEDRNRENPSLWDIVKNTPEFREWLGTPKICDSSHEKQDDGINHPKHYTSHKMECIEEMRVLFGDMAVIGFCICNAWKYRERAGLKQGTSAEQDHAKADYYIEYAKKLTEER